MNNLDNKAFFFIHIPKTGGTSFRTSLINQFDPNDIYPNPKNIKTEVKPYTNLASLEDNISNNLGLKLFAGHFPFKSIKNHIDKFEILTFIRNPIDRTISHLQHAKDRFEKYRNNTLEEIYDQIPYYSKNLQCHYFSNHFERNVPLENLNFEEVKSNFRKCAFVGILERYNDSIDQFNRRYNLNLPKNKIVNVAKNEKVFSSSLKEKIRMDNLFDLKLYNYCIELMEKK